MDKQRLNHFKKHTLAFLTPYYQQGRGNATTARRIVEGLKLNGVETNVVAYNEQPFSTKLLGSFQLLHVLHFRRFAEWLETNNYTIKHPYVITSGGTDVNIDIFKPELQEKIGKVLKNAAAITVFSDDAKQKLVNVYDGLEDKIHIINQSVWFPKSSSIENTVNLSDKGPNIVLPAGLRAVKDVLFTLPALKQLKQRFSNLTFTIIGAPLEPSVVESVQAEMKLHSWINYYEEVPLHDMEAIYKQSDIIINSSHSEGQSSALLEAMLLKKPIVARNNGGNKAIVQHSKTGFLFNNLEEFYQQVELLLTDETCKQQICANAYDYVNKHHSLQQEIECYLHLYEKLIDE